MQLVKIHCFMLLAVWLATSVAVIATPPDSGRAVVIWISIDGVRPDYLDRAETPAFDRLRAEGAWSSGLAPVFPSLTFPNHASQATGVLPGQHGIVMNSFYDRAAGREFNFPGHPRLLQAEPIWITAERQGRRTAVFDWVHSYGEYAGTTPAYHADHFRGALSDRERLQLVLDAWQLDTGSDQPLQLLMGYMMTPDAVGHQYGPDSPEIDETMAQADAELGVFLDEAITLFDERRDPHDQLYVLVTSDHGMSEVHTVVNPYLLSGLSREEADSSAAELVTSGNVAQLYLLEADDAATRRAWADTIVERVREFDFADVYHRADLPARWGYEHAERTGDVVIVLHTGYTFNRGAHRVHMPREDINAHLGMHGYDVVDNPEMNGIWVAWRYPQTWGGIEIGPTHSLQLHATIADWLGIEPAPAALQDPIRWGEATR